MIEVLLISVPAILTVTLYYIGIEEKVNWKKAGFLLIGGIILSNIVVRAGLWIIGMREFVLSDMGMRFKINYFILQCGILFGILTCFKLLCKKTRKDSLDRIKRIIPMELFLVVTFFVFMPSSLFLSNINEFGIPYSKIVPILLLASVICFVGLTILAIILPSKKIVRHYATLVFSVALALYVQGNFLNPNLPELDGGRIDWSQYTTAGIISICFWLICIVGLQVVVHVRRDNLLEKITVYASYFIAAVQIVTLATLLITAEEPNASDIVLTTEGQFTVGTDNNVIVFVVDSFESKTFEDVVLADEQYSELLQNFTFFNNAVSGGAYTSVALPLLLTGIEYEPTWTTYDDYLQEAWKTTGLYNDLNEQNYDVRIFSDPRLITNVSDGMIDNARETGNNYYIKNYTSFTKNLYKMVGFYAMPQFLKEYFWLYSDDLLSNITSKVVMDDKLLETEQLDGEAIECYSIDDVEYYKDFVAADGLEAKYENALRIYHLFGAHFPFTMNEDVERVSEEETSEIQQIQGVMKILTAYIGALKEKGLYDNSTIIITSDHGGHQISEGIEQNPCFLIKGANEYHDLQISNSPIHFRNVVATIAKVCLPDYHSYGPSIYDIDENSDVERLQTVVDEVGEGRIEGAEFTHGYARFIIPEDARDTKNIQFHDVYNLNNVTYVLGEEIRFTEENSLGKNIDYRLYKENNLGIASNELTLCFEIQDYEDGDLEFEFVYRKVYNDVQNVRVYAGGDRIASLTCTTEECGTMQSMSIPEKCVEDGKLVIRMVFPNAVTPRQIDELSEDSRVLSVGFERMLLKKSGD